MPFTPNGAGLRFTWQDIVRFFREKTRNGGVYKPAAPVKALVKSLILTAIAGFVWFFVELPALNPHSQEFYWFVIVLCGLFSLLFFMFGGTGVGYSRPEDLKKGFRPLLVPAALVAVCIAASLIGAVSGWVLLRASSYSQLLPFETGDFATDIEEVSWDAIPMLDSDSANTLASRKLGELSDLVSQFEVDEDSAQINYNGAPVRVNYLDYGDIVKWFNNRASGIPAYIVVNMQSQSVSVVRLQEGIKYSPSEILMRDLSRHLRFCYPTAIFGNVNFEIDEEGVPYWVASVEDRTIGLFGGVDIEGAVLCNAITGECQYYPVAEVPSWVDRVYDPSLVMEQYDYYGMYHNGFINSVFGQQGCTVTTDGYNYLAMDDDVWLYTGVTSVGGDESNVGFLLVNQRTKAAHYYVCAGAEEYSGMYSAEGAVQQYGYEATFPLLLNIGGKPTYFMALKDAASLVKMYAMVNVQEYQIVATGTTVSQCLQNYRQQMAQNGIELSDGEAASGSLATVKGRIDEIRSAVVDGNTTYYIRLKNGEVYYAITAAQCPEAVILNTDDQVEIAYYEGEGSAVILSAESLTRS